MFLRPNSVQKTAPGGAAMTLPSNYSAVPPGKVRVLTGKRVTLGVTGSIAAFKAVGLASALHQAGAMVDVAMTPDAQRFIEPLSFQAITHRPVFADLWAPGMETDIAHVTLGRESDVIVVAPATANILAKLAHGLADDPVSVTALAARCPVVVAPAMDAGRYIGNHSSGKMGYAVAEAARDRGAEVVLVTTPTALRVPAGVEVIRVSSAEQMLAALAEHYPGLDALIMAAAVADFKVSTQAGQKIKRGEHALELRLVPNPDLLAVTASLPSDVRPIRVGFAAETQDLVEHAAEKLARKSLDLIVANDVSDNVFGADSNQVTLLWSA